jgi:hypothetical protein
MGSGTSTLPPENDRGPAPLVAPGFPEAFGPLLLRREVSRLPLLGSGHAACLLAAMARIQPQNWVSAKWGAGPIRSPDEKALNAGEESARSLHAVRAAANLCQPSRRQREAALDRRMLWSRHPCCDKPRSETAADRLRYPESKRT